MLQVQGEPVIRHRWVRDERNSLNQIVPVFEDELIEDVGVDVADSDEPRNQISERNIVERVLFIPPGVTISPRDQFTVHGLKYGVEGYAPPVRNFFTAAVFRTEVKLKRVTG